jgi:hypothetical protein
MCPCQPAAVNLRVRERSHHLARDNQLIAAIRDRRQAC